MCSPKQLAVTLLVMALHAGVAFGIEPVNPNLNPTTRKVLNYLESVYQKKTLAGYNVYDHTPDDYEQTGMQAAVWGRDMQWLRDPAEVIEHAKRHRYILTLHWHWHFDNDSAWKRKRKSKVDVGRMVTPGTPEHKQAMAEIAAVADTLQRFEDADIPVLWRPLHEIDGGWFWWTDREAPENTAKLWRLMFDYMVKTRRLDNLIWVYSAGGGEKTAEVRRQFYPGATYVDISGLDVYRVDFRKEVDKYWAYYNTMAEVSPGKMLACEEGDAIPDPVKTQAGTLPKWLYVMPWWGAPSRRRPVDWATFTMRHDFIVTLKDLPAFGPGNIAPHVGILSPVDDGSAWYVNRPVVIEAYAVDRDGTVDRVDFYANDKRIGTDRSPPYAFTWSKGGADLYDIQAEAIDNRGEKTRSNTVRVGVGLIDLARGKAVVASSGDSAERAVDGDYHTTWSSVKTDEAWIYVDLGREWRIDHVRLLWGWKIHARDYSIDVATTAPGKPGSWRTVHSRTNRPYQTWEAADTIRFDTTSARYIRLSAKKRAGGQTWGGYQLAAFEILIPADRETSIR
jgi:mannan endo-1,4-beta-mannosidase